jgi:hypothetical protein
LVPGPAPNPNQEDGSGDGNGNEAGNEGMKEEDPGKKTAFLYPSFSQFNEVKRLLAFIFFPSAN